MRHAAMHMIDMCPAGKLAYEINGEPQEQELSASVAVVKDGPLWVTGYIPVQKADGQELEVRNRVTLCRCGHSKNKPLCDGTHKDVGFRDSE